MRLVICLCASCLILMLGLSTAQAAILFSAGFEQSEGYSDGALEEYLITHSVDGGGYGGYIGAAGNQQGWYGTRAASPLGTYGEHAAVVSNVRAHSGTQSLCIPVETYFYNQYHHAFEQHDTGIVSTSMYVWLDNVQATGGAAIERANNSNGILGAVWDRFNGDAAVGNEYAPRGPGGGVFDYGNDYGTSRITADTPNRLRYTDAAGNDPTFSYPGIGSAGAWVGRRVDINVETGLADYLVDTGSGWVEVLHQVGLYDADPASPVDELYFYQLSGSNYFNNPEYNAYVDDILVEWVPEPASLGLFAVAAPLILVRRRPSADVRGFEV